MAEFETGALQSQLEGPRQELQEYEELRRGQRAAITLNSWDDPPRALVQARIAAGLSQRVLAERLGLKEQQVQRYEATNYRSASLTRVRGIASALGNQIRGEVFLEAKRGGDAGSQST